MPTSFFKRWNIKEKGFSIEIEILSKFLKQISLLKKSQLNMKADLIQGKEN